MSAQSEAQFIDALEKYRLALTANPAATPVWLMSAAQAHVGACQPLDELAEEYRLANDNPTTDRGRVLDLAQQLNTLRSATEIVAGNLPYRNPTVTTE